MRSLPSDIIAAALEVLPTPALVVDMQGNVRARNREAEATLANEPSLQKTLPCLLTESKRIDWPAELSGLGEAGKQTCYNNLRLATGDSSARLVDVHLVRLSTDDHAALVIVEDVTAKASMERRLATSERLASVGCLAAQVAHELNNPLDGILRYIGLAERVCKDTGGLQAVDYLDKARTGLRRMAQIVAELLDFARLAGRSADSSPLSSLINQAVEAMWPSLEAAGVKVVCNLHDVQNRLIGGHAFQVLCNLIKNAADAMSGGGVLVISAKPESDKVVVTVSDDGPGIGPELQDRIFEPFFTTKSDRQGTGLGLSICRDIVQRDGGTITAANRPEGGAVFTFTLPCRIGPAYLSA